MSDIKNLLADIIEEDSPPLQSKGKTIPRPESSDKPVIRQEKGILSMIDEMAGDIDMEEMSMKAGRLKESTARADEARGEFAALPKLQQLSRSVQGTMQGIAGSSRNFMGEMMREGAWVDAINTFQPHVAAGNFVGGVAAILGASENTREKLKSALVPGYGLMREGREDRVDWIKDKTEDFNHEAYMSHKAAATRHDKKSGELLDGAHGFVADVGAVIPNTVQLAGVVLGSYMFPPAAKPLAAAYLGSMGISSAGAGFKTHDHYKEETGKDPLEDEAGRWAFALSMGASEVLAEKVMGGITRYLPHAGKAGLNRKLSEILHRNLLSSPAGREVTESAVKRFAREQPGLWGKGAAYAIENVDRSLNEILEENLTVVSQFGLENVWLREAEDREDISVLLANMGEAAKGAVYMSMMLGPVTRGTESHQRRARRAEQGISIGITKDGNAVEIIGEHKGQIIGETATGLRVEIAPESIVDQAFITREEYEGYVDGLESSTRQRATEELTAIKNNQTGDIELLTLLDGTEAFLIESNDNDAVIVVTGDEGKTSRKVIPVSNISEIAKLSYEDVHAKKVKSLWEPIEAEVMASDKKRIAADKATIKGTVPVSSGDMVEFEGMIGILTIEADGSRIIDGEGGSSIIAAAESGSIRKASVFAIEGVDYIGVETEKGLEIQQEFVSAEEAANLATTLDAKFAGKRTFKVEETSGGDISKPNTYQVIGGGYVPAIFPGGGVEDVTTTKTNNLDPAGIVYPLRKDGTPDIDNMNDEQLHSYNRERHGDSAAREDLEAEMSNVLKESMAVEKQIEKADTKQRIKLREKIAGINARYKDLTRIKDELYAPEKEEIFIIAPSREDAAVEPAKAEDTIPEAGTGSGPAVEIIPARDIIDNYDLEQIEGYPPVDRDDLIPGTREQDTGIFDEDRLIKDNAISFLSEAALPGKELGEFPSRKLGKGKGITAGKVQELVNEYSRDVEHKSKTVIVQSQGDLLDSLVNEQGDVFSRARDETGLISGFYSPGTDTVYLVADNLDEDTVFKAYVHEQLLHKGIRMLIPNKAQRQIFLQQIFDSSSDNIMNAIGESYKMAPDPVKAEEYLAYLAEKLLTRQDLTKVERTTWKTFTDKIHALINKVFGRKANLTTEELHVLIRASAQEVIGYVSPLTGSGKGDIILDDELSLADRIQAAISESVQIFPVMHATATRFDYFEDRYFGGATSAKALGEGHYTGDKWEGIKQYAGKAAAKAGLFDKYARKIRQEIGDNAADEFLYIMKAKGVTDKIKKENDTSLFEYIQANPLPEVRIKLNVLAFKNKADGEFNHIHWDLPLTDSQQLLVRKAATRHVKHREILYSLESAKSGRDFVKQLGGYYEKGEVIQPGILENESQARVFLSEAGFDGIVSPRSRNEKEKGTYVTFFDRNKLAIDDIGYFKIIPGSRQGKPVFIDKENLLTSGQWIETGDTRVDDNHAGFHQRKVLRPRFITIWHSGDNTNPGVEFFDTYERARQALQEEGDYTNVKQSYRPVKELVIELKESWVNDDNEIVEDGGILDYEDWVQSNISHPFARVVGQDSVIDVKQFKAANDTSRELEDMVYNKIHADIIKTHESNGVALKIMTPGAGKYRDIIVTDSNHDQVGKIVLRVADHSYNPVNNHGEARGGNFISVEIANIDPTALVYHGRYGVKFNGNNTYDEVVGVINNRVAEIIDGWEVSQEQPLFKKDTEAIPSSNFDEIIRKAGEAAAKYRIPIIVTPDSTGVPGHLQKAIRPGDELKVQGVFDKRSGLVYLVANNIPRGMEDNVILHEVLGHKGLRAVLGEKLIPVLEDIYNSMAVADRSMIADIYRTNDRGHIAEEYLAHMAETYKRPNFLNRAISKIRALIREVTGIEYSKSDIRHLLSRGENYLIREKPRPGDHGVSENYLDALDSWENGLNTDLARFKIAGTNIAADLERRGDTLRETMQDSMITQKRLQQEVAARAGKDSIEWWMDAYNQENRSHGIILHAMERMQKDYTDPLIQAVFNVTRSTGADDLKLLQRYMKAKHAPERNRVKSKHKGLTSIENQSGFTDEEANAITREYEAEHDIDAIKHLWEKVNAFTRFTLRRWLNDGMIKKELYDSLTTGEDAYKYYVPLKGHEDITDSVFRYQVEEGEKFINPYIRAEGRGTEPDDPIQHIVNMGQTAIVMGEHNRVKQYAYRMIQNHKNPDLYHIKKVYYINTGVKDIEGKNIFIEQYESPSREEWDKGLVHTRVDKRKMALSKKKASQHEVEVMVGGEKIVMRFENPGVSNAINKDNMERLKNRHVLESLVRRNARFTRWLTANFTAKNPAFIIPNTVRDVTYALMAHSIHGNAGDAFQFFKHLGTANLAMSNYSNWDKAKQDLERAVTEEQKKDARERIEKYDTPRRKHMEGFLENGGATGFIHLKDIDLLGQDIEKEIKRASRREGNNILFNEEGYYRVWKTSGKVLEALAQRSENMSRLSAYIVAIEAGKSPAEAASIAKNISINFNRKGTQSNIFGAFYAFLNAGIQGGENFFRLAKEHPGKFVAGASMFYAFGVLNTLLAYMNDDEEEKLQYKNISPHVKRTNVVIRYSPERYISIPLPHAWRGFYGLGVSTVENLFVNTGVELTLDSDNKAFDNVAIDAVQAFINTFSVINPLNAFQDGELTMEGVVRVVTPTTVVPWVDISVNKDFAGREVYRRPFMREDEAFLADAGMYKHNVNPVVKKITDALYALGGGDLETYTKQVLVGGELQDTSPNLDFNPSKIEHVIAYYTGGRGTFFNDLIKTTSSVIKGMKLFASGEENAFAGINSNDIPVVNRFNRQVYNFDDSRWYKEVKSEVRAYNLNRKRMGFESEIRNLNPRMELIEDMIKSTDKRLRELRELRNNPLVIIEPSRIKDIRDIEAGILRDFRNVVNTTGR